MRTSVTYDGVVYAPGARFRVVREGARLAGQAPFVSENRRVSASVGWSQDLQVGDEIVCTGFGPGSGGDPGYGVEFTSDLSTQAGAFHCSLWPQSGGVFDYRPQPGYLEPLTDGSDEG